MRGRQAAGPGGAAAWGAPGVPGRSPAAGRGFVPWGRAQGRGGCVRAEAEPSFPWLDMRVGIQVMRHPPGGGSWDLGSPQCPSGAPQHGARICPAQQWLC